MIQDIAPHLFDNHYEEKEAAQGDFAVISREMEGHVRVLLIKEEGEQYRFPTIAEAFEKKTVPENLTYFFALDGSKYFRSISGEELSDSLSGEWFARTQLRYLKPRHTAFAAVTALALDGWYRTNVFCSRCGKRLEKDHRERMLKCPDCGNMVYPRINPAVIVGVCRGDSLLMTKYAGRGYRKYALVAGFAEIGETIEETVEREVKEETGLSVSRIRYYKSQPWPFTDTLLLGFYCEADGEDEIRLDDGELQLAEWVKREEIDRVQDGYDDVSLTCEMIKYFRDHPEKF